MYISFIKRHVVLAAISFAFFGASIYVAQAQTVPDPVQYIVAPEAPAPNQLVAIETQGIGSFIGDATITWTQDGKIVKSGTGERNFSFTAGALGTRSVIKVTINSATAGTFTRTFTFTPSLINLVWEADTVVPSWYRGKALYSAGSDIKVVVFPVVYSGSSRVAASALSFQWSRNGDTVPEQSGLGRSVFSFTGDQLQDGETAAVDVYYGNAKVGRGEVSIPRYDPEIRLYQYDPLRGTLHDNALPAAISLLGKEITLRAEPFYFSSAAKKNGLLKYAWILNGNEITGPQSADGLLTLRQTGSGAGTAQLEVSLQNNNSEQFVQTAKTALQLVFGSEGSSLLSNFFGI